MRLIAPLIALLLVAGCRQEPGFDERYRQTRERLEQKASAIDRELDVAASDAAQAEAAATDPATDR